MPGFHLSLLEVLHTPKRAAAEEAGGGIVREVSQCTVPQKAPLHWQLCLLIFPNSFFEELWSQWPQQKRGTNPGTPEEEECSSSFSCCLLKLGSLQSFFPDLYFLSHLINTVVSRLGFFPLPSPCTFAPSLWNKILVGSGCLNFFLQEASYLWVMPLCCPLWKGMNLIQGTWL